MSRATFKVKAATVIEQGQCVKLDGGELVPTAAIDDECIGTIEDSAEGGELRAVNMMGPALVKVDTTTNAIAPGDKIVAGANGLAVVDPGTGARRVIGEALEASDQTGSGGNAGELIYCLIGRVFEDLSA